MLFRKQILLDSDASQILAYLARLQGSSESMVLRDLIKEKGQKIKRSTRKLDAIDMMLKSAKKLEKLGLDGAFDSSTNDDYIYR